MSGKKDVRASRRMCLPLERKIYYLLESYFCHLKNVLAFGKKDVLASGKKDILATIK